MAVTWKRALQEAMVSGTLASVFSAGALALFGQRRGAPAAPVNAVSHWFFGDRALREDAPSLLFTGTGYATHHAASLFWAVLHARAWGARDDAKAPGPAVAGAVVASAVACVVDYQFTPKRLTPGFEHRLSRSEMAVVYGCVAAGLALGSMLMRRR